MSRGDIFIFGFRGFPGVQGGIETHAEHLAPELVRLGYRVTACFRSPYVGPQCARRWNGVRLVRLWTVRNAYLETLLHSVVCALVAGIRRPKIVHIQGIGPALVTPLLRIMGLRVVVTHHGEDYNRDKWGWGARLVLRVGEAFGMRFAHKRIVISRSIEKLVARKYARDCHVIPNGVPVVELPTQTKAILDLGLEPSRYVLTVGRLVPEKRQLDLLRAFVKAELQGWKLVIVGREDHGSKYGDLLVSEAAKAQNVLMAGFQSGEPLRQLYAHAGFFVLPSSHEGLPIVLLEALSYGLPVLVSDIPSNLEVVNDPARVFRMGDIGELAAKLTAMAGLKLDLVHRDALRRECLRRYEWAEIARRTSAAYDEVIIPARHYALTAASGPNRERHDSFWKGLKALLRPATKQAH